MFSCRSCKKYSECVQLCDKAERLLPKPKYKIPKTEKVMDSKKIKITKEKAFKNEPWDYLETSIKGERREGSFELKKGERAVPSPAVSSTEHTKLIPYINRALLRSKSPERMRHAFNSYLKCNTMFIIAKKLGCSKQNVLTSFKRMISKMLQFMLDGIKSKKGLNGVDFQSIVKMTPLEFKNQYGTVVSY